MFLFFSLLEFWHFKDEEQDLEIRCELSRQRKAASMGSLLDPVKVCFKGLVAVFTVEPTVNQLHSLVLGVIQRRVSNHRTICRKLTIPLLQTAATEVYQEETNSRAEPDPLAHEIKDIFLNVLCGHRCGLRVGRDMVTRWIFGLHFMIRQFTILLN